jgi:hypothetical protein
METIKADVEKPPPPVLKFKTQIDALKLSINCPQDLSEITEDIITYRFCHNPIDLNVDFLPNVLYDKLVGIEFDYSATNKDEKKKCSRCGASFQKMIEGLISTWNNLNDSIKTKLGYSAIAKGTLSINSGLVSISNGGHIGFYEYEKATYHNSFGIEKSL